MEAIVLEPQKLRPEIIQRVEAMDEESLLLLHRLLLRMEKERLWRELSAEAEAERGSGKFDRLSEIIREARTELRKGWFGFRAGQDNAGLAVGHDAKILPSIDNTLQHGI